MMHPVGPHDAQTYWIRRAVVAVVAVALVAGVVWWALGRGSGPGPDTLAATTSDTTTPPLTGVLATDPAAGSSSESGLEFDDPDAAQLDAAVSDTGAVETGPSNTATSGAAVSGTTGTTAATSPTGTATTAAAKTVAAAKTTAATTVPDASMVETTRPAPVTVTVTKLVPATGTATKPAAPKTTAPPKPSYDAAGRLICPAASISLTGVVWGTVAGQQPRLGMNATNVGKDTCQFNATGAAPVYTVTTTAGAHIWSTADCFPSDPYPVTTLRPSHKVSDVIVWSGTTSAPGCSAPRVTVKAGTYVLVIQLGAFKSKPLPFTMK